MASIVEEYKSNGTIKDSWNIASLDGKFIFKANKKYYNKIIYCYGFDRDCENGKNNLLVVEYPSSARGTQLEKKLMSALDEAASTYTETIISE